SVKERLLAGLDQPTLDYIRAVVLLASLSGGESKFMSYNSLACLAASLVTRLGWNNIDLNRVSERIPWEEWVDLEIKRRTFWVVYQIDSYQGMLADRPTTLGASRLYISLPGSDYTWDDASIPQISHWPLPHQPDMSRDVLIKNGALSYSLVTLCDVTAIVSQITDFLWNVKISISSQAQGSTAGHALDMPYLKVPPPLKRSGSKPVASLFEYSEFRSIHEQLTAWKSRLIRAEDMRDECSLQHDFAHFGSLEHRRFLMRIRYFCLYCCYTPTLLCLHLANRPSYFLAGTSGGDGTDATLPTTPKSADCMEDRLIREMLSMAFSDTLNDGLLAYDIVDESWDICLEAIYDLVGHLDRNADIPIERCDQVMPFCLFTSITVLIRQIRKYRQRLHGPKEQQAALPASESARLHDELAKSVGALRRLWTLLQNLGFMWGIKGMEHLLRSMQVDEVANAADLFSGLSL
ncbi:hypothetical protein GQ54DRAFT_241908, partial [Martensiomyces pterosporus]